MRKLVWKTLGLALLDRWPIVALFVAGLVLGWLLKPIPEVTPCEACPDCVLERAAVDETVPLAPIVEERWGS